MTDEPGADDSLEAHEARLAAEREVQERLVAHPGYRMHLELQAFATMLAGVFRPNAGSLMRLLDEAATNQDLAVELIQNAYDDAIAREFRAEASRLLHNYVAATMTLVEHSRRLMRGRLDPVADAWDERRAELLKNGEVPFMMDLRVFIQHRTLPVLAHTLHLESPNTPDATWDSEVELGRDSLLGWDGWKASAREFLTAQAEAIQLRPLVKKHTELVYEANAWLHQRLQDDNKAGLDEANRLIVEMTAARFGSTFEEAEAFTERITAERSRPRPDPRSP